MVPIIPSEPAGETKPTAYESLLSLTRPGAKTETEAIVAIAEFRSQVEGEMRQKAVKDALLKLHDWDELIFGGFYCMHCTPDDADDVDQNIAWPCPPLQEVGVTYDEAARIIVAHRGAINCTPGAVAR
ncbi:hypothetical protein [Streptomyces sp. DW26H14]|uniref:hypothetical protein n=1 Tax=Streptomyces sp. DW26H14 TaxID=3435395 RepID=UPI00403DC85C